jgi:PAS domain S-box-containing protein
MADKKKSVPRRARVYAWSVVAAGATAIVFAVRDLQANPVSPYVLIVFGLTLVSGFLKLRLASMPLSFSLSEAFTFATLLLFGPAAAALMVGLDGVIISVQMSTRQSLTRLAFNGTAPLLAMWLAGSMFSVLFPAGHVTGSTTLSALLPALAITTLFYFVVQTGLVAGAVALSESRPIFAVWRNNFARLWVTYFGGAYLAALLALPSINPGGASLWLLIPLPFVLHSMFRLALTSIDDHVRHIAVLDTARTRAEGRYRSLIQGAVYGIYTADLDDQFTEVNPALVAMLGYGSPPELIEASLGGEIYVDVADRAALQHAYRTTGRVDGIEVRWRRKDGTVIIARLSGRAVADEHGKNAGVEMIAEDVTERRALEDQLRQAQKMEAVGRLAGGVAHDFNNLLTAIIGYSDLVREQIASETTRRDLDEVRAAAMRASELTRQLLAFSRKQVLTPAVLDLNLRVSGLQAMLQRLIGEHVRLQTMPAPNLWRIKGDAGQVEQVIVNLAVNARDAMPDGGRLAIATHNQEVDAGLARRLGGIPRGRYVVLTVSDTGVGMDAETKKHLFEPFFTTKDRGKGTGLGLASVYGVVKQSGGYIFVDSELGHGTTFTIYFPQVDEIALETELQRLPPPARGYETILLAEDEEAVRRLATQALQRQGYRVLPATNGEDALALFKSHSDAIQLLLSDIVMPGMSGPDLAIRLLNERPDLKVLFMSGYTDDLLVPYKGRFPDAPLLQKPFTPVELTTRVREILDEVVATK